MPKRLLERKARTNGFTRIAGIDEAGRGPLAGPLVAACVIASDIKFVSRINDSKLLTPQERNSAYQEIVSRCEYGIGVVSEDMIDIINIYQATKLAMKKAVLSLSTAPDYLLIDGVVKLELPQDREYVIKGDRKSLAIACASIIAKVTRDRIMQTYHQFYPQYCFDRHKGYGTKYHMEAIAKFGPSPIHRISYEPVSSMIYS